MENEKLFSYFKNVIAPSCIISSKEAVLTKPYYGSSKEDMLKYVNTCEASVPKNPFQC
jgi:hypothetical protein